MATYYAQRKSILSNVPQSVINKYGGKREMERQFHLFCANACDGTDYPFDVDSIEWGTVELGAVERKVYYKPIPEQEESEEPVEGEGE